MKKLMIRVLCATACALPSFGGHAETGNGITAYEAGGALAEDIPVECSIQSDLKIGRVYTGMMWKPSFYTDIELWDRNAIGLYGSEYAFIPVVGTGTIKPMIIYCNTPKDCLDSAQVWTDQQMFSTFTPPGVSTSKWEDGNDEWEYESSNACWEFSKEVWPDKKPVEGRRWIVVRGKTSSIWSGLSIFRVGILGTSEISDAVYVRPSEYALNPPIADHIRGINVKGVDKFAPWTWHGFASNNGVYVSEYNFYNEKQVESGERFGFTVALPSAGTLVIAGDDIDDDDSPTSKANIPATGKNIVSDVVQNRSNAWGDDNSRFSDESFWKTSYAKAIRRIKVSAATTLTFAHKGRYQVETAFNRMYFFPADNKSVAIEVGYFDLDFGGDSKRRGINLVHGRVTGSGVYKSGETAAFKAIAGDGEQFDHWEVRFGNLTLTEAQKTSPTLSFKVTDKMCGTMKEEKQIFICAIWKPKYKVTALPSIVGAGTVTGSGRYHAGTKAALSAVAAKGYDFVKWSDGETAAKRQIKVVAADAERLIYACFRRNDEPIEQDVQFYTVKFDGNGATSGTMKNQSFTYGKAQALTANAFKRTNYHLKGWSKTKGGKLAYTDKQSVKNLTSKAGATVTLYAVWELSTYKVKFDGNGATSGTMKAQSINAGAAKALTANAYKRTGYTFLGWATKKDATKADYKDKAKVKNLSTKNGATVTLYAVWKGNSYKIAFNANGGTGKMKDLAMTYGKAKALTANAFKRTNFTFQGWAKKKGATKADYKDKASVKNLKASGTVSLYAVWKRNTYSIAFDANGGTGTMKAQAAGCGEAAKLSANGFKRAGFTFKGWATSKTATTAKYSNKAKVKDLAKANKGVTLYAVWWISAENVVGSYEGMVGLFDGDEEDGYGCAVVKLDVAKTGAASATVSMMGRNYSFSSAKPSSYREADAAYIYNMKTKDGARLGLVLDTKLSGFDAKFIIFGDRCASTFTTPAYEEDFRVFLWKNGHGASGAIESDPVARDHVANIKSLKKVYLKVGKGDGSGAYPLAKATSATADMTLSIGADGVVTLSGKALGASVSGKSMLKIDDDSYYTICDLILPNVPERGKILYLAIGFSPYPDDDMFKLSDSVWCEADLLVFEL